MNRPTMPDFYALLGVPHAASLGDIKKAYRNLAARYHPDKHRDNALEDLAKEKLTALNEAYETLSDSKRRAEYDAALGGQRPVASNASVGRPPDAPRPPFQSVVRLIVILGVAFFALRFLRSPRAIAVVALAICIFHFGPRILRALKSKK